MRKTSFSLLLVFASACNGDATGPGEPTPTAPLPPTPQPLSFPLRNTIAYVSYRYDPAGDVFLIDSDGRKIRVSGMPTTDMCPAISPDGSALAYYSDGLVLQSAAGKLILAGTCAKWSADGSKLFSFANGAGPTRVYSKDGQLLATIDRPARATAISPDEQYYARIEVPSCPIHGPCPQLVVLSRMQNFVLESSTIVGETGSDPGLSFSADSKTLAFGCASLGGPPGGVCLVDVTTGTVTRRIEKAALAAWSPITNTLAYICHPESHIGVAGNVCVTSPSGGVSRLDVKASALIWSADGNSLLVRSGRANTDLFVVNADGSNLRNITRDRGKDEIGAWAPFSGNTAASIFGTPQQLTSSSAQLSEDELLYEGPVADRRIWAVSRTGNGRRRLFNVNTDERCVKISPDRRFVSFESLGVWVAAVDGSVETQLWDATVAHTEQFGCPKWSPDGTHLAWLTGEPGAGMQLWVGRMDGSEPKLLAQAGELNRIAWDFESRSVFHDRDRQRARTFLDGSTQTSVIDWDSMRADGKLLIRRGGEICIADANGNVLKNMGPGSDGRWSPDGSHFVFARSGGPGIMVANADGTDLRELSADRFLTWASWEPTGAALATLDRNPDRIVILGLDGKVQKEFAVPEMWRFVWGFQPASNER